MVSFFGLKLGGDKKKKLTVIPAAEISNGKTRRLDLDEPPPISEFENPRRSRSWTKSPRARSGSVARPGTSHSFRSVSAPRPMFMNGTATASLVDLQSFDQIPRPYRDSLRQNVPDADIRGSLSLGKSGERFSIKPPAAVGGVLHGSPRSRASSKAQSERPATGASNKPWTPIEPRRQESLPIDPRRKDSLPVSVLRSNALDSLFSGADNDDDDENEHELSPPRKEQLPRLSPIVPPSSLEAALSAESPHTPLTHSPLTLTASPARSYTSGNSPRTYSYSPKGPGSPYSPSGSASTTTVRPKMPSNSQFKPYSPAIALAAQNAAAARPRSPSASTLNNQAVTPRLPPAINTSFSVSNPAALEPSGGALSTTARSVSASTSPMLPESPLSQFNFEFDFRSSSGSTNASTALSRVAAPATMMNEQGCLPSLETGGDTLSRVSTASPSPSLSLSLSLTANTAATSIAESALSPRPSLSNSSNGRNIPSPSHSMRSVRSVERPSFERALSTKPAAPSGLRVVRNAVPSIGPDTELDLTLGGGLGLGIQSTQPAAPSSVVTNGNFGARSPTPEDDFILQGDEALALQWEGPPVIKNVAAKRDTLTLSSPRHQSFTSDTQCDHDESPLNTLKAPSSPPRPKTSAGPGSTSDFSTFGPMPSFTRSCSTDGSGRGRRQSGMGNTRLSALRPANLNLNTTTVKSAIVRSMPKSPLSVAPQSATLQTAQAMTPKRGLISAYDIARSQSPLLNIAMRSPTFGMPTPRFDSDNSAPIATPAMASPVGPSSPEGNETMASPASVDSMGTMNSPIWQETPALTLDVQGLGPATISNHDEPPVPPARHPGRLAGLGTIGRSATWQSTGTVVENNDIPEPQSAVVQTVEVTWPLSGSSSPGSPKAKPMAPVVVGERKGVPGSVRDRVRNLEVREQSVERERSRSRSQGRKIPGGFV